MYQRLDSLTNAVNIHKSKYLKSILYILNDDQSWSKRLVSHPKKQNENLI